MDVKTISTEEIVKFILFVRYIQLRLDITNTKSYLDIERN